MEDSWITSIEEKKIKIHEPHPQEEHPEDFLNQSCKHIEYSWITYDE